MKHRILIATGGTGGHLFPAQQFADVLLDNNPSFEVLFVGKNLQINPFFNPLKYPFREVDSAAFSIKKSFFFIRKFLKGFFQTWKIFLSFQPSIVVGFGSFYTFPVLAFSYLKKVPIILFESNRHLGKVNKFFARKALFVASQFDLENYFGGNIIQTPLLPWNNKKTIISSVEARKNLLLNPNIFTFLVFGGSQGAKYINRVFLALCKNIEPRSFQVVHLTGDESDTIKAKAFYYDNNISFVVKTFEKNMQLLLSAADIAICRAGASTLAELISFQIPSILIPFSKSSGDHQTKNALYMENVIKGGLLCREGDNLFPFVQKLMSENMRYSFRRNIGLYLNERKTQYPLHDIIKNIGK